MKTAIITVDNLLFESDLTEQFARALVDANKIDRKFLDDKSDIEEEFDDGIISAVEKENQEIELYDRHFKDLPANDLLDFLRQGFDLERGLRPWARELIALLQENGYVVVIRSISPEFILDELQDMIGSDTFFSGSRSSVQRNLKQAADQSDAVLVLSNGDGDSEVLALSNETFLYEPSAEYYEQTDLNGKPFTIVNEDNLLTTIKNFLN